jgi:hypothetical protein
MKEPRMKDEGAGMNEPNAPNQPNAVDAADATKANAVDAALDWRVVQSLERAPGVDIPAGFAARVAGQLPARPVVRATPARYGFIAMRVGMAALLVALVALAMRAADRTVAGVTLEWVLCTQFIALALWLTRVKSLSAREA